MSATSTPPPSLVVASARPPSLAGAFGIQAPWTTPRRMKGYRAGVWVLVALLFLFGEGTLVQSRDAFKTIGKDTVPSIIAAQEIGYALADLDANVANALLGTAPHQQAASAVIEKQRLKVTDSLVDAAQNITYGDTEKIPIRMMTRDLGLYLELAAQARLRLSLGDVAGATSTYWEATDLLHKKLLVEATDLDAANKVHLDLAYRAGGQETAGAEHIVIVLGLGLSFLLLYLQLFLFRRTRRVFSLPLVGATCLTVVLAAFLATRFVAARDNLRVAKEDAFDSIHSLVRARTLAYDANGDESRVLLEGGPARGLEPAFRDKVAMLTTSPTARPPTAADLAARKAPSKPAAKTGGKGVARDTGLLWDELDNVTFPGELNSATAMMSAFRDYMVIDAKVRKLAASGKTADAIELAIGSRLDESNAAFERFDGALVDTLNINRVAFDAAIDTTSRALKVAEVVLVVLSLAIAALTWLGLRPRLREYTL